MNGEKAEGKMQKLEDRSEKIEGLLAVAGRWRGTPFREHARVCGAGVDCVQLAAAILEEADLAHARDLPPYIVDFGEHADHSPLLAWFQERPEWQSITDPADVLPGDVVLFRVGRVANHCGVALGDRRFIHCLRGHGVLFSRLDDPTYARRFIGAFRPPGGNS